MCSYMYIRIIHGHVRTISSFFPLPIPSTLKPVNASETSSRPFFSTWNMVEKKRIDTFWAEKHLTRQKDTEIKVRSQIVLKYASMYLEQKLFENCPHKQNHQHNSKSPNWTYSNAVGDEQRLFWWRRPIGLSIPLGNDDGSEEMPHPSLSLSFTSIGSSRMTQLRWNEFIFQDLWSIIFHKLESRWFVWIFWGVCKRHIKTFTNSKEPAYKSYIWWSYTYIYIYIYLWNITRINHFWWSCIYLSVKDNLSTTPQ